MTKAFAFSVLIHALALGLGLATLSWRPSESVGPIEVRLAHSSAAPERRGQRAVSAPVAKSSLHAPAKLQPVDAAIGAEAGGREVSEGTAIDAWVIGTGPEYPLSARRRGEGGSVALEVLLAPDGTVKDVRLARSSGHKDLDQAAIRYFRQARFSFSRPPDEPFWKEVTIVFKLV